MSQYWPGIVLLIALACFPVLIRLCVQILEWLERRKREK